MHILSKPLNLIDCHGNEIAKFAKNIKKSTPHNMDNEAETLQKFS